MVADTRGMVDNKDCVLDADGMIDILLMPKRKADGDEEKAVD